jgi:transposase
MVCHFLPKFHPEMNPIEYFWAWVKRGFRVKKFRSHRGFEQKIYLLQRLNGQARQKQWPNGQARQSLMSQGKGKGKGNAGSQIG